jgi:hypothetical protein
MDGDTTSTWSFPVVHSSNTSNNGEQWIVEFIAEAEGSHGDSIVQSVDASIGGSVE